MLRIFFRRCKSSAVPFLVPYTNTTSIDSAELEMTVGLLVQIDKLVMLIESPVFTCESHILDIGINTLASPR